MFELPNSQRQIAAVISALSLFAIGFIGLGFAWWAALIAAALVYAAMLRIVSSQSSPDRRMTADGADDIALLEARGALQQAAARFRRIAISGPGPDRPKFQRIAELLDVIDGHHKTDPKDLRHTTRFIRHDLGRMIESAEQYSDLAARTGSDQEQRLEPLRDMIAGFIPALEKIDRACLENDFMELEVQLEVLSDQLRYSR